MPFWTLASCANAVPPSREGLILLAIDGFDELVDADGHRDAWYDRRDFLEEVGHGGFCVLAGRDTFFDQQGFLRRLESVASRIALTQAHLGQVKPADARAWLIECGWPTELAPEDLFEEAAKDMAEREADTVGVEYLSFLCEVSFGGSLQGDAAQDR